MSALVFVGSASGAEEAPMSLPLVVYCIDVVTGEQKYAQWTKQS